MHKQFDPYDLDPYGDDENMQVPAPPPEEGSRDFYDSPDMGGFDGHTPARSRARTITTQSNVSYVSDATVRAYPSGMNWPLERPPTTYASTESGRTMFQDYSVQNTHSTPSVGPHSHVDSGGPSLLGAFTSLIQRYSPQQPEAPVERVEHEMGRLGEDLGRRSHSEDDTFRAQFIESPDGGHIRGAEAYDYYSNNTVPMSQQSQMVPTSSPQGWSDGGWGWGSLFESTDRFQNNEGFDGPPYDAYHDPRQHDGVEAPHSSHITDANMGSAARARDHIGPPTTSGSLGTENGRTAQDPDYSWPAREASESNASPSSRVPRMLGDMAARMPKFGNMSSRLPSIASFRSPASGGKAFTAMRSFTAMQDLKDLKNDIQRGFQDGRGYSCSAFCLSCAAKYTEAAPARCPCTCAFIYLVVAGIVIGIGFGVKPMEIETDFDSFMKTDVNSSTLRDTFKASKESRATARRLQSVPLYRQDSVFIGYEMRNGISGSVFSQSVLSEVARFEQALVQSPGWSRTCGSIEAQFRRLCSPGLSLVNYALPHLDKTPPSIVPTKMTFNGLGADQVPLETTLKIVERHDLQRIVLPLGWQKTDAGITRMFRSIFRFKTYCCESTHTPSMRAPAEKKLKDDWDKLVEDEILPFLQKWAEDDKMKTVHVFYDGTTFEQIEVMQTLMGDNWLAAGGMCFVLLYLVFHTQSIFLSAVGLFVIILSVPFSYVAFVTLAGTQTMSIASFLSLFLVVGLGSDVVFVYTDFWREAIRSKDAECDRLSATLQLGGKASLATTATTALSFFANLASVLRPLREFGFFMGLCVVNVWFFVTLVFVPLLAVDARFFNGCRFRAHSSRVDRETSWQWILGRLSGLVYRWRFLVLGVSVVLWLTMVILVIVRVEIDSGVPNLFPSDHNRNRGKKLLERFEVPDAVMGPLFLPPRFQEDVCNQTVFRQSDVTNCSLFWCEVQAGMTTMTTTQAATPTSAPTSCRCYKKPKAACRLTDVPSADVRVVSATAPTAAMASQHVMKQAPASQSLSGTTTVNAMAPILLEEWEKGDTSLQPMTQITVGFAGLPDPSTSCGWEELCFCQTYVCKWPSGWAQSHDLTLNTVRLLSERSRMHESSIHGRHLQAVAGNWVVAQDSRASVEVVFGIQVNLLSPLLGSPESAEMWSFMPKFNLAQPWAQRNIYTFCSDLQTKQHLKEVLRVATRSCWIEDFRQWLIQPPRNERFPLQANRFHSLALQFGTSGLTNHVSSKDYLWIRGAEVKACFLHFGADVHKHEKTSKAINYMKEWDNHLETYNEQSSRFARGAWHTSDLWVRAEAQNELIASTIATLVIVLALSFLGMLFFTFDFWLSIYVVVATFSVITGLAFFIIVVMNWAIGPIEVIALIVFIGYAVTYSLHIAHKYGSPDAVRTPPRLDMDEVSAVRFQRTEFAMKAIGSAALGSAATTIGCSIFLLFCTLTIFQKLGGVVLAVTFMSIFTALVPLPAMLHSQGPTAPGKCPTRRDIAGCCDSCYRRFRRLIGKPLDHGSRWSKSFPSMSTTRFPTTRTIPDELPCAPPGTSPTHASKLQAQKTTEMLQSCVNESSNGDASSYESPHPSGNGHDSGAVWGNVVAVDGKSTVSGNGVHKRGPRAEVDDVMLSEKGFDIGEESRLEPIRAANVDKTGTMRHSERWRARSRSPTNSQSTRRSPSPQPDYQDYRNTNGSIPNGTLPSMPRFPQGAMLDNPRAHYGPPTGTMPPVQHMQRSNPPERQRFSPRGTPDSQRPAPAGSFNSITSSLADMQRFHQIGNSAASSQETQRYSPRSSTSWNTGEVHRRNPNHAQGWNQSFSSTAHGPSMMMQDAQRGFGPQGPQPQSNRRVSPPRGGFGNEVYTNGPSGAMAFGPQGPQSMPASNGYGGMPDQFRGYGQEGIHGGFGPQGPLNSSIPAPSGFGPPSSTTRQNNPAPPPWGGQGVSGLSPRSQLRSATAPRPGRGSQGGIGAGQAVGRARSSRDPSPPPGRRLPAAGE